jgi:hypothetical protein
MTTPTQSLARNIDAQLLIYFLSAWESEHLTTIQEDTHILFGEIAADYIGELLDHYLSMERFTCCDLCVGLDIHIDGTCWTGCYGDHFWHFIGWFHALSRILQGGAICETTTFVWDESCLKFQRNNDTLTLYDEHTCRYYEQRGEKHFEWSPITVDLWDFARKVMRVGELYALLIDRLLGEIALRGFSQHALLSKLSGRDDKSIAGKDDIELKLAIIVRELSVSRDSLVELQNILRTDRQS